MLVLRTYSKKDKEQAYDYNTIRGAAGITGIGTLGASGLAFKRGIKLGREYAPKLEELGEAKSRYKELQSQIDSQLSRRRYKRSVVSDLRNQQKALDIPNRAKALNEELAQKARKARKLPRRLMYGSLGLGAGYALYRELGKKDRLK